MVTMRWQALRHTWLIHLALTLSLYLQVLSALSHAALARALRLFSPQSLQSFPRGVLDFDW